LPTKYAQLFGRRIVQKGRFFEGRQKRKDYSLKVTPQKGSINQTAEESKD
jgi:hypothetical protein